MKDLDSQIDLPMDEDENVGDGIPKKKTKRKKTREERIAERKVVFWTLVVILGTTLLFWIWPKITSGWSSFSTEPSSTEQSPSEHPGWNNYIEYDL